MKKFCKNITICSFIFCAIWGIAELVIGNLYIPNVYSAKYHYIKRNSNEIKTLLMGNSYFHNSINPYLLGDSVYDFAIDGSWIYWHTKIAEEKFPKMRNLKVVIFPLGYHTPYFSLSYSPDSESTKDEIYKFSRYMHIRYYNDFPQKYTVNSALINNDMKLRFWHNDSLGYAKLDGQIKDWKNKHNVSPYVFTSEKSMQCYREYKRYLTQLAKICAENSIRFIVVTCPCADSYIANTREQGVQNLYALIDSVSTYYPIEYYNYLNDVEFRADSLYYNSSHLNSIGADKFAKRLKKDLCL